GNILSNNGTVVINTSGTWVGPSANIGSGGLTVTAGGAAITGNSNITGTLGVTSSLTAGSITTSGAMNASGKISATAAPTGIGVSNGSFYVNPASATFDNTLFGVAVNGTQKFRVDAEGDTAVGGDLTVTGTLNATVASAGNATTVNGIGASAIATPNMLFPLDGSGKFPASVITSSGLDADTVDTFHASSTATSGYLYPLGIDAKFPNSVLNTGIGSGLNADQVDGFHASSTALSGYLYPLGVGNKFPNSVLNTGIGGGLDADSVDGIHASTAPLANTLLALDGSGKFPSSVLDTAGINAGTLDSLDSTAFGQITASNSWTGTTNTFKEVDIASGSVIKLLDGASGAIYLRNNSGTLQFLENDGATAACTISQTGVLTVAGGLTVSSGTVSLPTGSITGTHVFDRTIASVDIATGAVTANELGADSVTSAKILDNTVAKADINTNAVTADKQITPVYVGGAGANTTAVADCGAGFVAVGGGGSCLNSGGSARSVQESCPSSVNNACTDGAALRYWFLRCSGNGSSTSHQVWAICMKAN
ncbi:MAG: hypothetical protein HYW49_09860, partial [Deltaproteobacteria bacterium]|nr:hypothetical protein [Deltaproteobacteria bacterium]